MTIKAIDTEYGGHLFRSRLEARWAVYFDELGIQWEYETEGFRLPDGTTYLPDFRAKTPQGDDWWVEVKPYGVTTDPKFRAFERALQDQADQVDVNGECVGSPTRTTLVSGTPLQMLADYYHCPRCGVFTDQVGGDLWLWCDACDWETPAGASIGVPYPGGFLGGNWDTHKGWLVYPNRGSLIRVETRSAAAAKKAQQARFEHGETPRRPLGIR